jgi:lysosomal acid lipase/cholesteryl ester hydrolase
LPLDSYFVNMARVPVIGRLFWFEYLALFGSLLLVLLEWIIHIITFCLRE